VCVCVCVRVWPGDFVRVVYLAAAIMSKMSIVRDVIRMNFDLIPVGDLHGARLHSSSAPRHQAAIKRSPCSLNHALIGKGSPSRCRNPALRCVAK
jgi:hypothetical protein